MVNKPNEYHFHPEDQVYGLMAVIMKNLHFFKEGFGIQLKILNILL